VGVRGRTEGDPYHLLTPLCPHVPAHWLQLYDVKAELIEDALYEIISQASEFRRGRRQTRKFERAVLSRLEDRAGKCGEGGWALRWAKNREHELIHTSYTPPFAHQEPSLPAPLPFHPSPAPPPTPRPSLSLLQCFQNIAEFLISLASLILALRK
jgi:hypothetical protein